ncbi:hypothetical protein [Bombella sp. ESL0385]|uniref:hypothetical protein n=1 Tax=Bombella sp. ESL0385 TaxID=2676446 RepID=UPI001E354931|nr:hypothetical protein [Bombella sp. ESL0385]
MARVITFTLPRPTPSLNTTLYKDKFGASREKERLRNVVWFEVRDKIPPSPFQFARVEIERWSVGTPDKDNLNGGVKALLDCLTTPVPLQVRTPGAKQRIRNKYGLGLIVDDAPEYADVIVRPVKCRRRAEQKTVVTITEIEGGRS